MSEIAAIILAAGRGSRLGPRTSDRPKCLVQVAGRAIIDYALDALQAAGIGEVVIVVGYREDQVRDYLARHWPSLNAKFVVNDHYLQTGTAQSLQLGLAALGRGNDTLIVEGDVAFEPSLLLRLLAAPGKVKTAVQSYREDLSGTFVAIDDRDQVVDWLHASHQPSDFLIASHSKTVNVHLFRAGHASTILLLALETTLSQEGLQAPIEYAMRRIVQAEEPVRAVFADDLRWYEVDDEQDLQRANSLMCRYNAPP
ncbi:phosphocholine cytidylyltransferase family protein [Rhodopseudomonas palustris]|uniref:Nucleotidyl transferase n=1 Tax=Rhodopseudomonas palustris (strain BisB18) TaxID=316056 RepID=Q20ZN4_RHOPB